MNDASKKQIQLLDWQFLLTILSGIVIVISLILIYDAKMEIVNGKKILTDKLDQDYALYSKILVVGITLAFLYINYQNRKLREGAQEDLKSFDLQILASWLTVIASIIILYVVASNYNESTLSIVQTENPTL